jgi:hypothetical protein
MFRQTPPRQARGKISRRENTGTLIDNRLALGSKAFELFWANFRNEKA